MGCLGGQCSPAGDPSSAVIDGIRDPRQHEYARDAADNLISCLAPSIVFKVLEVKVKTQDV